MSSNNWGLENKKEVLENIELEVDALWSSNRTSILQSVHFLSFFLLLSFRVRLQQWSGCGPVVLGKCSVHGKLLYG